MARNILAAALLTAAVTGCAVQPPQTSANMLLMGEVHDNPMGHQQRFDDLRKRVESGWRPAIVMEQFDRENQAALTKAQANCPGAQCVIQAAGGKRWQWPFYEPVITLALQYRLPLLAGNVSRTDAVIAMKQGLPAVLDANTVAAFRLQDPLPADLFAGQRHAIETGHCGKLPESMAPAWCVPKWRVMSGWPRCCWNTPTSPVPCCWRATAMCAKTWVCRAGFHRLPAQTRWCMGMWSRATRSQPTSMTQPTPWRPTHALIRAWLSQHHEPQAHCPVPHPISERPMKHHQHQDEDNQNAPCQQIRLAQSSMGEICICPDCGVVHVALQYFSMRFELETFRTLQAMLCQAQSRIEHQRAENLQKALDEFAAMDGKTASKSVVH